MPVLMDNYTTSAPSRPLAASFGYKIEREPLSYGIVVAAPQQMGLNACIHKLLADFSKLQNNWDENEAAAPHPTSLANARFITTTLERLGLPIFHAAPGPNGEIMLDIRNRKKTKSLELVFYPTRSVAVGFSAEEQPFQQNFELQELPGYLEWLNSN